MNEWINWERLETVGNDRNMEHRYVILCRAYVVRGNPDNISKQPAGLTFSVSTGPELYVGCGLAKYLIKTPSFN